VKEAGNSAHAAALLSKLNTQAATAAAAATEAGGEGDE